MVRDLAEETIDGSAFDDFSASSMLAIIGRQVGPGLCLFKVPMIRDLAEETVDGLQRTHRKINADDELARNERFSKNTSVYIIFIEIDDVMEVCKLHVL